MNHSHMDVQDQMLLLYLYLIPRYCEHVEVQTLHLCGNVWMLELLAGRSCQSLGFDFARDLSFL